MALVRKSLLVILLGSLLLGMANQPAKAALEFDCTQPGIGVPQVECEALLALFESTNGPEWTNTTGIWGSAIAVADWYGVTVSHGYVHDLELSGNNLRGTIPPEIGNLSALWTLVLDNNSLSGPIPAEVFNIYDIHTIELSNNQLSGQIPTEIGTANAVDLFAFHVSGNNLSGTIPSTIGSATELNSLKLDSNDLYGPVPTTMINLVNLTLLDLGHNGLWATDETDETLQTFLNTEDPDWSTTQTAQGLHPANDGIVGWAPNSSETPTLKMSNMWYSSWNRANEFRIQIFRKSDSLLIYDKTVITYTNDGNPDNDICPAGDTWNDATICTYKTSWSDFSSYPVTGEDYYWRLDTNRASGGWVTEYDIDEFRTAEMPVPISPEGIVTQGDPLYTWSAVNGAISYNLVVTYNGSVVRNSVVPLSACGIDVCAFTPFGYNIPAGDFTWRVRAKITSDPLEYTSFLSIKEFTKVLPPSAQKPIGKITAQNPAFTWTLIESATKYKVKVLFGTDLIAEEIISSPTCNTSTCTNTAGIALGNGDFSWQVAAYTNDWGDYGDPANITKLSPPAPKFPSISATVINPKFIWGKVAEQTKYRIVLLDSTSKVILDKIISSPTCTTTTCSFTPSPALNLANGAYKWKVKSFNGIWGDYSAVKSFKVVSPPAAISPTGTITATNPLFKWKKIPGATKYLLELRKSTGVLVKSVTITSPSCTSTTCSYTFAPALNLAKGDYKWHIKAYNGYYGPYGAYMVFKKK